MPNIAQVIKQEITRYAQKEAKAAQADVKKEIAALRKENNQLKLRIEQLEKSNAGIVKNIKTGSILPAAAESRDALMRYTSKNIRSLRRKLDLTQVEMAALLDVTGQSVYQWERTSGPLRLRERTRKAIAQLRSMSAREARLRLVGMGAVSKGRPKRSKRDRPESE